MKRVVGGVKKIRVRFSRDNTLEDRVKVGLLKAPKLDRTPSSGGEIRAFSYLGKFLRDVINRCLRFTASYADAVWTNTHKTTIPLMQSKVHMMHVALADLEQSP